MNYTFLATKDNLVEKALDMLFFEGGDRVKFLDFFKENKLGIYREDEIKFDNKLDKYKVKDGYIFADIDEGDLYELAFCILGVFMETKPLEIIDSIVEKHLECLGIEVD